MRLVLSLPDYDPATHVWTSEMMKDKYINKLKEKYDVVILYGDDAVPAKWWSYNSEDTIYAGVGHGNFFIYTGQGGVALLTNESTDIAKFNAFGFAPVACLVWNGDASICQKLSTKTPIVIGEVTEYSLTDNSFFYVGAEVNILYNLDKCQNTNDLRNLIDESYKEQIKKAYEANDPFDASILEDDRKNRKCILNKPITPPPPPQPTESYIELYHYDTAGNELTNVVVKCLDTGETHNTINTNWTVFRLEYGKTYTFESYKDGYYPAHTVIKADAPKKRSDVIMIKMPPPVSILKPLQNEIIHQINPWITLKINLNKIKWINLNHDGKITISFVVKGKEIKWFDFNFDLEEVKT